MIKFGDLDLSKIGQGPVAGLSTPKPYEKSPGAKLAGEFYLQLKKLDCIKGIGSGQLEITDTAYNLFVKGTHNSVQIYFVNVDYFREVKKREGTANAETAWDTVNSVDFDKFKAIPHFLDVLQEMPEEFQSYIVTHIPEFGDYDASEKIRESYMIDQLLQKL